MTSIRTTPEAAAALAQSRWAAPVLAALRRDDGARFVALANGLGVPRDTLVHTLRRLIGAGLVMRNPGHGHPLRPEYVLTTEGMRLAVTAESVVATEARLGLAHRRLTRWGLPVVAALVPGPARFGDLAVRLEPVTPRALTASLRALTGDALVQRTIRADWPPVPLYGLTDRGTMLAEALGA